MKKTRIFVLLLILSVPCVLLAQSSAGEGANVEPTMLIDKPTAGMLHRGGYWIGANFFQRGGVLFGVSVGLLDQFSFGISYGGTDVIGANKPEMNPFPGVQAKLRLFEESTLIPAIAIGFDSQGKEAYLDDLKRYSIKSPGFFAVASQNYSIMGNLSLHGGINYSLERDDGDKDINFFAGAEKSLGKQISLLGEYDFSINDNNTAARGRGRGYLNLGLRWSWGKGLVVGIDLKDIIKNQQKVTVGNRTIQIEYVNSF